MCSHYYIGSTKVDLVNQSFMEYFLLWKERDRINNIRQSQTIEGCTNLHYENKRKLKACEVLLNEMSKLGFKI